MKICLKICAIVTFMVVALPAVRAMERLNEDSYLRGQISRDLVLMAEFAVHGKVDWKAEVKVFPADGGVWDPVIYAAEIHKRYPDLVGDDMAIATDFPERMLEFSILTLARENDRVSRAIQSAPRDPQLHEEAALALAVLALHERAGRFHDTRHTLSRLVAHLAFAKVLRGTSQRSPSGHLAEAILMVQSGHQEQAIIMLDRLPLHLAAGDWGKVIRLLVTNDWRDSLQEPSMMLRMVHTQAVLASSNGQASMRIADQIDDEEPQVAERSDWHRMFLADPPTRKYVIGRIERMLRLESVELAFIRGLSRLPKLDSGRLIDALNVAPGLCVQADDLGTPVPHVIDWGTWAAYTQRHICHVFTYVLGSQMLERKFSGLRLYPFVLLQQRRKPAGIERAALQQAVALCKAEPQSVNAVNWIHLSNILYAAAAPDVAPFDPLKSSPYVRKRESDMPLLGFEPEVDDLIVDFPIPEQWFAGCPRGSVYQAEERLPILDIKTEATATEFGRWNRVFTIRKIIGEPEDTGLERYLELAGELAEYDIHVMDAIQKRLIGRMKEMEKMLDRIVSVSPPAYLGKALTLMRAGRLDEAERAFGEAVTANVNPRLLARYSGWLVDYHKSRNQIDAAMSLLRRAADAGGYREKAAISYELAKQGKLLAGERGVMQLQKKYQAECPLLDFYVRQGRLDDRHNGARSIPRLLKETMALKAGEREKAIAKAEEIVFPGGRRKFSTKRALPPNQGLMISRAAGPLKEQGVRDNVVLVALNGIAVEDVYQYYAMRNQIFADEAVFTFWQDDAYRKFTLNLADWDAHVTMQFWQGQQDSVESRIAAARKGGSVVKQLDLSELGLKEIPDEVFELQELEALDLSGNPLSDLSSKISRLTELQQLVISRCNLTKLPSRITKMAKLQVLQADANALTRLPDSMGKLSGLRKLDLKDNQLKKLPSMIGTLFGLQFLRLTGNRIDKLPNSFSMLANLRVLSLGRNEFKEFPTALTGLKGLRGLLLFDNQIPSIPSRISGLKTLERLDLRGNLLEALPAEMSELTTLRRLQVGGNRFTEFPSVLLKMPNLTELDLGGNGIIDLPKEISMMTGLQRLTVSSNRLFEFPLTIQQLEGLKKLDYGGNYFDAAYIGELRSVMKNTNFQNIEYGK